jgi:hypothetical protein
MSTTSRNWYQEPLVWMLVAIPLSSVLVGIVMLWLAITNEDGLVVDDYYKRGLEINRTLERDAAATEHALTSELRFATATDQILVTIEAADGFEYPETITLGIYHSVKTGFDKEVVLARISDKAYSGPSPELIPGRWYLDLHTDRWRITGQMTWPVESVYLRFHSVQRKP